MAADNDIGHNQVDEVDQAHQGKHRTDHSANQQDNIFYTGNSCFHRQDRSIGNICILRQIGFHLLLVLFLYIEEETVQGRSFINLLEFVFSHKNSWTFYYLCDI